MNQARRRTRLTAIQSGDRTVARREAGKRSTPILGCSVRFPPSGTVLPCAYFLAVVYRRRTARGRRADGSSFLLGLVAPSVAAAAGDHVAAHLRPDRVHRPLDAGLAADGALEEVGRVGEAGIGEAFGADADETKGGAVDLALQQDDGVAIERVG